jgi:hypothetical protein
LENPVDLKGLNSDLVYEGVGSSVLAVNDSNSGPFVHVAWQDVDEILLVKTMDVIVFPFVRGNEVGHIWNMCVCAYMRVIGLFFG